MRRLTLGLFAAVVACGYVAGCRSPHVEVTVANHTGAEVRLLEIDYPSASFGADRLAPDATLHYRIQLQGQGPVKVQYTAPDRKQPQITGPTVSEGGSGSLQIDLFPGGKAEFHPALRSGK